MNMLGMVLLIAAVLAVAMTLKSNIWDQVPYVSPTVLLVKFDHGGETVNYYNNSASVLPAGTPIIQGALFGVPGRPIEAYSWGALLIEGAMSFPKAASDGGMAAGSIAYWDDSAKVATGTANSNAYIGKVEIAAVTADISVLIQVESAANASGSVGFGALPSATVAATGTSSQAGSAPIATGFTLATSDTATKGLQLPSAVAGAVCIVKNSYAGNLLVYPFSGDAINAGGVNAVYTMGSLTSATFTAYDATTWYTTPLVAS